MSVGAPLGADPRDAAAYEVQEGLVILIVVKHVPRRGERVRPILRLAAWCRTRRAANVRKEADNQDQQNDGCEVLSLDAYGQGAWAERSSDQYSARAG